jgi:hypothetical protein
MVLGRDIDALLEMFGSSWRAKGFYCKIRDCLSCWRWFSCNLTPPKRKEPFNTDFIIHNLKYGFPLTREEFHAEVKRRKVSVVDGREP